MAIGFIVDSWNDAYCTESYSTNSTRRVPRVGVSKSGNTPRFFPDARFGTDRGPTVHALRASDKSCAGHEPCAAHNSIAMTWRRRADVQVVPNFGGESIVCASADER